MVRKSLPRHPRSSFRDILRQEITQDAASLLLKILTAARLSRITEGRSRQMCILVQTGALSQLVRIGAMDLLKILAPVQMIAWIKFAPGAVAVPVRLLVAECAALPERADSIL
jgi:hypothetical protein